MGHPRPRWGWIRRHQEEGRSETQRAPGTAVKTAPTQGGRGRHAYENRQELDVLSYSVLWLVYFFNTKLISG